jgi:hypothetical protein
MFNVFRQNLSRSQGGDNPRSPYLVACGAKASRGHWQANSETGVVVGVRENAILDQKAEMFFRFNISSSG